MADVISETPLAEAIVETITQPLLVLDGQLRVELANAAFLRDFQVTPEETVGLHVYSLGNGQWDAPDLHRLLEAVLTTDDTIEGYRIEHTFESIGKRIMLLNARRIRRDGVHDHILLAISDVTERERIMFELEGQKEFAEKLVDSVREAILVLGWDLRVHSANLSFYETFRVGAEESSGRLVYELGNGQWDIPELRLLLEDILPKKSDFDDFEVTHDFRGIGRRTMVLNGRRLDHLNLIVLAIRDITDQRRHETRQTEFMGELQHRVKNILSNVRALVSQTRRGKSTVDDFVEALELRLGALARVQDLLLKSPSESLTLHDIARLELEAVGGQEGIDFTAEGPTVSLSSHDAQVVAMAIHELTTNAGKYGALSSGNGKIEIAWQSLRRNDQDHLSLQWRERGVHMESTEPTKRYGARVIEQSVPYMLAGTSDLTFHHDGVECRLEFPLPTRER